MPSFNESIVEDAVLEWFWKLGYAVGQGILSQPADSRKPTYRHE
jgi:hypothetical protein